MPDLERLLADARPLVDWPPTPDVAPTVARRLAAPPARRARRSRRTLALAVGLALLLASAAVAAVPAARDALGDLLGIGGVEIERVPTTPRPPARPGTLDLGDPATLAAAGRRVGFRVLVPRAAGLGSPQVRVAAGGAVHLAYPARPGLPAAGTTGLGLLLSEFRGVGATTTFLQKSLGPGTRLERVPVGRHRGVFMSGAAHQVVFRDPEGRIRVERPRLAGDALIWQRGSVTLRLEGRFDRERALRIARSVR